MSITTDSELPTGVSKSQLRSKLRAIRSAHPDREAASQSIMRRLAELTCFRIAPAIGWYVSAGSEVMTRNALQLTLISAERDDAVASMGRRCHAVPYCCGDELLFYQLRCWEDLEPSKYDILAPKSSVRQNADRAVAASQLDVVIVPGVGFDSRGNRLGQGKGYYDRYLSGVRRDSTKIGLAFDSQIVGEVPHDEQDLPVDLVITETMTIYC